MRVPDKPGRKENKKINFAPVFSFLLLISLCFSVLFYSMSPSLAADNKEKLTIILIDGEEIYLRSGSSYTFLQDYQLYIKGTDTEGKRVWVELSRKGVPLQDAIVTEGSQFVYMQNSTEILNLTVNTIYAGADGVLVGFSPVYQYLDTRLPMPQNPVESHENVSEKNVSPDYPEMEPQAKDFDMPLFLLGLGTVLLATGFFAGKRKGK
jgi:hypothetical protein